VSDGKETRHLEQLGSIFAELFTVPDDTLPDPIIGPLAERSVGLPEDAIKALIARLSPTDCELFWTHFALIKQREELVTALWDRLLRGRPPAAGNEMASAELQMTLSTHITLLRMAWKLVLHMRGKDRTEGQITSAIDALTAEDPDFRELAESVSALLQWERTEQDDTR
jgi:hypothetical protein